ncbi:MAG: thiamine pyrophosphate-binding protein [Methanomicrobiales archaeon]|nr:thiamine pyrophosphate-binding protein [Methanomicrobiales archaeon]
MKATVADLIFQYLDVLGVEYIFGVPGMTLEPFLGACRKNGKVIPVLTKHEEGAAFMADGYARVHGTMGACFGTSGPGVTNLISGIANSYVDEVPVIVFTGQIPTFTNRKGTLQDSTRKGINSVQLFDPVCKSSVIITSKYTAQYDIRQALEYALSGKRGPVHLSIPKDIQAAEVEVEMKPSAFTPPVAEYFDRRLVINAAEELVRAVSPVILIGSGAVASGASEEIKDLAEMVKIPVATTPKAKGAFPEDHPLALGVLGLGGSPLAEAYIKSDMVDLLLVVGASLNQATTLSWDPKIAPSRCLIHINIDPTEIGVNYHADIPLVGDARTIVNEISFRVLRFLGDQETVASDREEQIAAMRGSVGTCIAPEKMMSNAVPLKPQRLIRDLEEALPDDAILFTDVGSHLIWAIHYLNVKKPGSFIAPFGLLTMGYATAAAIGGKLAAKERPVVALVGDGCFQMNGMEVATAVNYNVPVVWVIMNNGRLGLIHALQRYTFGDDTILTKFSQVDFARIAEGLGAVGVRVTCPGELTRALPEAIRSERPTVIDCIIDPDELPPVTPFVEGAREFAIRALL